MIVLGLDGATWNVIKPNIDRLPAFKELLGKYKHATLECDVRPVHSGPSWATIFSGMTPEQHGIRHFVMDKKQREKLIEKKIFVWDKVAKAIVMAVPIALPPLNRNYELADWEKRVLSITEDEMYESTDKLVGDAIAAIEYGGAELVVAVLSEPDRVQHMFWHKPGILLKHYQNIDAALRRLAGYLAKDDFLILSDHGFTDAKETKENGWDTVRDNQTGGHHPMGIAISNLEPPRKVTEVYDFISRIIRHG